MELETSISITTSYDARTVFLKPLILRARRVRKIKGFKKTVRN